MGKKPRQKSPVLAPSLEPEARKVVSSVSSFSYHHLRPSWRVASLELVDPYGWHRLSAEKLLDIRQKLAHFETMSWSELLVQGKKRNHSIKISEITSEARDRLEIIGLALDEVVSLRLSGKERVFGYLDNGVLELLWWDPDHQVCPSLRE